MYSCGPDEAMIISGCCLSRPRNVVGGSTCVWPLLQKVDRNVLESYRSGRFIPGIENIYFEAIRPWSDMMSNQIRLKSIGLSLTSWNDDVRCVVNWLNVVIDPELLSLHARTLTIETTDICKDIDVPFKVTSVAVVCVEGRNDDMLETASKLLLSKSNEEVDELIHDILYGHQKSIHTMMESEKIRDQQAFSKAVREVAASDLVWMGVSVVSYNLTNHSLPAARTLESSRPEEAKTASSTEAPPPEAPPPTYSELEATNQI